MDPLLEIVSCFGHGVLDSLAWPVSLYAIARCDLLRRTTVKCVLLNGVIFLGSLFFFLRAVKPTLSLILTLAVPGLGDAAWPDVNMANMLFDVIYHVLWVYPMYCVSFILNSNWYQEIADDAYALQVGRPSTYVTNRAGLTKQLTSRISDELYRAVQQALFLVQIALLRHVPYFGRALALVFMAWLYALYCFEYKWINKGWNLHRRLRYFEACSIYFCGFGVPFATCTFFFPQIIGSGVFALLFPSYIIMANRARPRKSRFVLPIFRPTEKATSWLVTAINRRRRGKERAGT